MNKLFIIIGLIATTAVSAQVAIEKTALRSTSSILEFNDVVETDGVSKGIILPVVDNLDSGALDGTLYVNANTQQIEYLTTNGAVALTPISDVIEANTSLLDDGEGTVITDNEALIGSDTTPAVLKLLSANKAMILPHVASVDAVASPEVGTIVYDQGSKSLAIFNGIVWSFWN